MVRDVGGEHLVDDDDADEHADHHAEAEDDADGLLRRLEALVAGGGLVQRPHRAVGGRQRGAQARKHGRKLGTRCKAHQHVVRRAGQTRGEKAQEGLVGDDEIPVGGKAAADLEGARHRELPPARLEAIGLARLDAGEQVARDVARQAVHQGGVRQRQALDLRRKDGIAEGRAGRIDAEQVHGADGAVRLLPVDAPVIEAGGGGDALNAQRLIEPVARQRAAVEQGVGVGGGDENVAVEHRVGQTDALHQRPEKAELHEDQHIGEGNAGQRRGQAPLVVHDLQPADGQPAEQRGEHGSERAGHVPSPVTMRAVTCRLVKRRTRAMSAGSMAT